MRFIEFHRLSIECRFFVCLALSCKPVTRVTHHLKFAQLLLAWHGLLILASLDVCDSMTQRLNAGVSCLYVRTQQVVNVQHHTISQKVVWLLYGTVERIQFCVLCQLQHRWAVWDLEMLNWKESYGFLTALILFGLRGSSYLASLGSFLTVITKLGPEVTTS